MADFSCKAHPRSARLYCTMIKHANVGGDSKEEDCAATYTLYLEHLGGYLPLLKGKKVSKIRPDFVVYEPELKGKRLKVHSPCLIFFFL